ncbi:hypothetical protein [Porphyromonas catoniae]|uniref:hypothetical protein n=1 Tax=Porphyromonas catoniae TaxID=41976 RepID=UPI0028D1E56C|nr:hypothetical protein [Porphyromonas catoniae]
MNTSSLHTSSLGRIFLLTKASLTGSLRSFLIFQLVMAIVFIAAPLLINLIASGFSLEYAYRELAESFLDGTLLLSYGLATWIYCLIWICQLVHTSNPSAFTQIPASVGEKIATMALATLGYLFITLMSITIIALIFSWIAPDAVVKDEFFLWEVGGELRGEIGHLSTANQIALLSSTIFAIVMPVLCMLYFRRPLFGFCAIGLIVILVVGISTSQTIRIFSNASYDDYSNMEQLQRELEFVRNVYSSVMLVINAAITYGIYYRLKTIQLK